MKILLWAGNKPIPELLRVAEELKDRGVLVDFGVLPETLTQCDKKFWDSFQQYDLVYYRTGLGEALKAELGLQIDNKVPILNRSVLSNYLISNKLYQAVQAQKLGIKIPKTVPRPIDFKETAQSLTDIQNGLDKNLPGDLIALDIRRCLHYLGEITGEVTNEDQLDYIFSKFCIGK